MRRRVGTLVVVGVAAGLLLSGVFWAGAVSPANEHFDRTWARTDQPVATGQVSRTWMWGPDGFTGEEQERYSESPGGQRAVQYFDKARMELTNPAGDSGSIWYVTNGLLVVELITGNMQVGDASFLQRQPAVVNVAGDADDPTGPSYSTFGVLRNAAPAGVGTTLTNRVSRMGQVSADPALASQGMSVAVVDDVTNHAIATPFWSFMNSSGTVWDGAAYIQAALFENAYFATGRPVTEAYWANVKVGGAYQDVLMQCFERRCLTYNPANAPEWRVEAGNVGRHYHAWRYGQPGGSPTATATATGTPDTATDYESAITWGGEFVPGPFFYDPHEIVIDAQGHLWLADTNNHRIVEFDANGVQLRTIGAEGIEGKGELQFTRPTDIAFDADGNIYVAEFDGHRIQKISPQGEFIKTWGKLGSALGEFNRPAGLAISEDMLYVTDFNNHRVQIFDLDGMFRGYWGRLGTGNSEFDQPSGIAIDPAGNVLVVEYVNSRIQKFDATGLYLGQFGSAGAGPGQFASPWGIAIDPGGTMYVAEIGNKRVQVLAANGDYIRHWGSEGSGPGQFKAARGVAVDGDGGVWTVEGRDARVQKFTSQGAYLYEFRDGRRGRFGALAGIEVDGLDRVLVPDGLPGYARVQIYANDGTPIIDMSPPAPPGNTQEFLRAPVDIALAPGGDYYILDENVVRRYSPTWEFVSAFGGTLAAPQAIAISSSGDVFIADTGNNMVQKFNADGFLIKTWGTTGTGDGQFDALSGIAVFGSRVYVADTNNSRIQVFDLDGAYIDQWGSLGAGDGELYLPIGIAADGDGFLYVVDHGIGRIQKFNSEGAFVAVWGSTGDAVGQLNAPWGVAVDQRGWVYVTEVGGYRVQAFRPVD